MGGRPRRSRLRRGHRGMSQRYSDLGSNSLSPVRRAEEIIEPRARSSHRRLAQLYAMADQCYAAVRLDEGVRLRRGRSARNRQRTLRRGAVWDRHRRYGADPYILDGCARIGGLDDVPQRDRSGDDAHMLHPGVHLVIDAGFRRRRRRRPRRRRRDLVATAETVTDNPAVDLLCAGGVWLPSSRHGSCWCQILDAGDDPPVRRRTACTDR